MPKISHHGYVATSHPTHPHGQCMCHKQHVAQSLSLHSTIRQNILNFNGTNGEALKLECHRPRRLHDTNPKRKWWWKGMRLLDGLMMLWKLSINILVVDLPCMMHPTQMVPRETKSFSRKHVSAFSKNREFFEISLEILPPSHNYLYQDTLACTRGEGFYVGKLWLLCTKQWMTGGICW